MENSKIFIIDDDSIFRFMFTNILGRYVSKDDIYEFKNGQDALNLLHLAPKHIFLDLRMPVIDGWEFMEEVTKRSLSSSTRIHIVSSSIDPYDESIKEKYELVKNYLRKPVDPSTLEKIIKEG